MHNQLGQADGYAAADPYVSPQMVKGEYVNEIETKYALFGLTEDVRHRLIQLTQLSSQQRGNERLVIVETVIVQDGERTVIDREEQNAYLV